jgi:hypothetical protein
MALPVTVNKKHSCNVAFINVVSKGFISKGFISTVVVSFLLAASVNKQEEQFHSID